MVYNTTLFVQKMIHVTFEGFRSQKIMPREWMWWRPFTRSVPNFLIQDSGRCWSCSSRVFRLPP